jgi:cbb3-type cytochrome oxidase maturation protein
MTILLLLIGVSLGIATLFLTGFIWAVKSGQFDDTFTPSLRVLIEDRESSAHGRKRLEENNTSVADHTAIQEIIPQNERRC